MPSVAIDLAKTLEITGRESEYNQRRAMGSVAEFDTSGGGEATNVVKVNQLDLTMPWDGFNNYFNNCIPSCVSMVLLQAIGLRKWPDEIVDWMEGEGHKGYTFMSDAARYMSAHGVPNAEGQFASLADFQAEIRAQIAANRLAIILVFWDFDNNSGGHGFVVFGCDEPEGDVGVVDPWKGVIRWFSWEKLYSELKGRHRILALKGPEAFTAYPESWTAWTTAGVNVRSEPFVKTGNVVHVLPSARRYKFVKYTDQGTAVGPKGSRRWHQLEGGGWVSGALLYRWERV